MLPVVVDYPADARHGLTVAVPMYATSSIATLFDMSAQTIRL